MHSGYFTGKWKVIMVMVFHKAAICYFENIAIFYQYVELDAGRNRHYLKNILFYI